MVVDDNIFNEYSKDLGIYACPHKEDFFEFLPFAAYRGQFALYLERHMDIHGYAMVVGCFWTDLIFLVFKIPKIFI